MFRLFLSTLLLFGAATGERPLTPSEIADRLSFYQKLSTIEAPFKQVKTIQSLGLKLPSEGVLKVNRPNRVDWKIMSPSFVQLVLIDRQVLLKTGEGKEAKVERLFLDGPMDPNISKGLVSMMAWLKLDIPTITSSFTITDIGKRAYKCLPKDPNSFLFENLIFHLHPKGFLEKLILNERSGDNLEISFSTPKVTFSK